MFMGVYTYVFYVAKPFCLCLSQLEEKTSNLLKLACIEMCSLRIYICILNCMGLSILDTLTLMDIMLRGCHI